MNFSVGLLIVLVFGCMLMIGIMVIQLRWYQQPIWKSIPISVTLVLEGVLGSQIWFYIENGFFEGRSLYGAIVFAPLVFFPVSKLLKIPYLETLDFCVTAGSLTLGLTKLQCLYEGCCSGIVLYVDKNYHYVHFPSQIVEFVVFMAISVILMIMSHNVKYRGKIFFWFLVIYGAARFVLNFFRDIDSSYALGLSAGSFWSLCSFLVGIVILMVVHKNHKRSLT